MLLAALAWLYTFGHGGYLLFDVDEAIFTQATVEMVENGNYVLPTYNAEPRYHKPPLIYWLQATSLKVFGGAPYAPEKTEFAVRIISGLAAWLTVLVLYLTVLKITNRPRFAVTTAAIFGLNLSWLLVARAATADAVLNLFILASTGWLLYMLYGQNGVQKGGLWRQVLAGVLLGLGVLAKGPVALLVPIVVIGTAGIFRGNLFKNLMVLNPLVILPTFVLVLAPWILAVMNATGTDFFKEFILVHNIGRFSGDLGNSQSNSGLYYVLVLLVGFFPWSALLPLALVGASTKFFKKLRSTDAYFALQPLALLWLLAVVIFFSFSGTKLAHYIVPALPAAALLVAFWLETICHQMFRKVMLVIGIPIAIALGAALLGLNRLLLAARLGVEDPLVNASGLPWPPTDALTANVLAQVLPLNNIAYVAGGILMLGTIAGFVAVYHKARPGAMILGITQFCWLSLVVAGVMPVVSNYVQKPLAFAALQLQTLATAETQVFHYGLHKPSVRLISGVPFVETHGIAQLEGKFDTTHSLVLAEEHRMTEVIALIPADAPHKNMCTGGYCVLEIWPQTQSQNGEITP